jgi:hypothetical protein
MNLLGNCLENLPENLFSTRITISVLGLYRIRQVRTAKTRPALRGRCVFENQTARAGFQARPNEKPLNSIYFLQIRQIPATRFAKSPRCYELNLQ